MKKLTYGCLAALLALIPRTASAQETCQTVGSGTERICYTGVFPSNPIVIELGQPVRLPATTYKNQTNRTIDFTIEWAGLDFAGSGQIDSRQLAAGVTENLGELAFTIDGLDLGTRRIAIGLTASGQEYGLTRELHFDLAVVVPGQVREIIQVPVRYCVIEGTPQAQGKQPGETVDGGKLLSILRKAVDDIWLPQAGILFRHASAGTGIPVVKDPDASNWTLGDVTMTGFGLGEWSSAVRSCEQAWNERFPGQRGIFVVNARKLVAETAVTVGGVAPGVPYGLWVDGSDERTGKRGDALCGNPRSLLVDDVTPMLQIATYDPALYKIIPYTSTVFEPARVIAHELGHALMLGHGNGLDDNGDGLLPPTTGRRRFDEYCDPLGEKEENVSLPSSLMRSSDSITITALQREMARAAAKLVPGAVLPDPVADPAGALVAAPGPCPPECTIPLSVKLERIEMADTPGAEVTGYTHTVLEHAQGGPYRYSVYADLDNNSQTGCSISEPGQPEFLGAELHTVVEVNASGGTATATPTVQRCTGGVWADVQDSGITATAYQQGAVNHDAPTGSQGVVSIQMPNAVRGQAGSHVRVQAVAEGESRIDLLPASGTGGVISLIPADLPTCSVSPVVARPGQTVSITANRLPGSRAVDVFVAGLKSGGGSTAGDGSVTLDVAIPATLAEGLRSVEVGVQIGAAVASCAVLVQGQSVTPATTATLTPAPNVNGWNNADVTVALNAVDASGSGVQSISYAATGAQTIAPTTQPGAAVNVAISAEGQTAVQFFATNNAGVSEAPRSVTISLDKTLPTVTYSGNQAVYGVLDTVNITCTASDSLSGLLFDTCADISGPAYQFALTGNTYSAEAMDFAGNVKTASISFQIQVTYADLCTLTQQFVQNSATTPDQAAIIGQSLCAQLNAAQEAALRGKLTAKRSAIAAYVRQVKALVPAVLTAEQAAILVSLAGAL